jgi:AcrR family transcriptional regulator
VSRSFAVADEVTMDERPQLRTEMRALARERILAGAVATLTRIGLEATVDDVAEAAGVSRRTVFRYFPSYGALFGAAITEVMHRYEAGFPAPPAPGEGLDEWLVRAMTTMHRLHREMLGRSFWDLFSADDTLAPEVLTAIGEIPGLQRQFVERFTDVVWSASGDAAEPYPPWLADAVFLTASAYASNALDRYNVEDAGAISARILGAAIRDARRPGAAD